MKSDLFAERLGGIPWIVLAGIALLTAVAYAFIPTGEGTEAATWIILRWAHTVAWAFFAAAAFVRARVSSLPIEWVLPLAATGGLVYVVYMVTVTRSA